MAAKSNDKIMTDYLAEVMRRGDEMTPEVQRTAVSEAEPVNPRAAFLQGLTTGAFVLAEVLWPERDMQARIDHVGNLMDALIKAQSATPSYRHV